MPLDICRLIRWAFASSPLLAIILAWTTLHPGIGGAFLFDDMANLSALDRVDLTAWNDESLTHYLSANRSGPTGRPVAMLSFLLHDGAWPSNPRPFLYANLLIHCLVGVLLLGLTRRLAMLGGIRDDNRATLFALLVSILWLLHPLHASTTFYAVQRMTQLSALFSVAAMYCYVVGRTAIATHGHGHGWLWIAAAPTLAVIGAYGKENAVLVPLGLLLIEYWFFSRGGPVTVPIRYMRVIMLWIPSLLILGYLVWRIGSSGNDHREFTAAERLLTQPRILFDYLSLIAAPAHLSAGLFNDTYQLSTSLLKPWTTLPAILGCIVLVVGGFLLRHRWPLASWGVVFFFAMHVLESSSIPLELYFEHRNYLPSIGIAITLVALIFALHAYRRYLGIAAGAVLLGSSAVMGHLRAENWGHPLRQAELWTQVNPDSPRAWQNLALRNYQYGLDSGTRYALNRWQALRPNEIVPRLSVLAFDCPQQPIRPDRWTQLRNVAAHGAYTHGILTALRQAAEQSVSGDCAGLRPDQVHVLVRLLLDNPDVTSPFVRQRLWHLDGQLLLAPGFIDDAMVAFRRSHGHLSDPPMRMAQARQLANRGYRHEAVDLLTHADSSPERSVYGPLHIYWLVYDEAMVEDLAREIATGPTVDAELDAGPAIIESSAMGADDMIGRQSATGSVR